MISTEHDKIRFASVFITPSDNLQAVHDRHMDICDHNIRLFFYDHVSQIFSIGDHTDQFEPKIVKTDQTFQHLADVLLQFEFCRLS